MRLREVIRRLRHGGSGVRVCPRCGSPRIRRMGGLSGWLLPTIYICPDCGYQGPIVLELEKEEDGDGEVQDLR